MAFRGPQLSSMRRRITSESDMHKFKFEVAGAFARYKYGVGRKFALAAHKIIKQELIKNAPSQRIADFINWLKVEKREMWGSGTNVSLDSEGTATFSLTVNPARQGDVAWALLVSDEGRGPIKPKNPKGALAIPVGSWLEASKDSDGKPMKYDVSMLNSYNPGKFPRSFYGTFVKFAGEAGPVQGTGWIGRTVSSMKGEVVKAMNDAVK